MDELTDEQLADRMEGTPFPCECPKGADVIRRLVVEKKELEADAVELMLKATALLSKIRGNPDGR